jgi:hypothetical protein
MGVKGFNEVVKTYGKMVSKQTYSVLISDGNNLIIRLLARYQYQMKKDHPFAAFQSIDLPIVRQYGYLIHNTLQALIRFVDSYQMPIVIVIDPPQTVNYYVNSEPPIALNLKEAEEDKRKHATPSHYDPDPISKSFDDEHKTQALAIYSQSYTCLEKTNIYCLIRLLIALLKKERPNVRYVQATSEADLVIRHIATEYEGRKLIQSADTDYYFLFADNPDVDVTVFQGNPIYNPNQIWNAFIGVTDMQYISRIAPILGNDFTLHESLMYADKNATDLLNLLGLQDMSISPRKKIHRITRYVEVGTLITPSRLDELIKNYNPLYYANYKNSSIVYLDLVNNTDYILFDGSTEAEFEYLFKKLNIKTFYEWDSSTIMKDKNAFIDNALDYEIEDVETFIVEIETARGVAAAAKKVGLEYAAEEDEFFTAVR